MTVANLSLYALTLVQGRVGVVVPVLVATAFLMVPLACILWPAGEKGAAGERPGTVPPSATLEEFQKVATGQPRRFPWQLVLFILAVYLIGGLASQLVYPVQPGKNALTTYVGTLPYVATALLASRAADAAGRTWLAPLGLATLGVAIALFPLADRFLVGSVLSHVLLQAGYGFADLFLWTYLADLAPPGKEPSYYGWGLGLNVTALFFGTLALTRWLSSLPLPETAVAATGATSLFLAVPVVSRLPAPGPARRETPAASPYDPGVLQEFGLTARQKEIALLVLEGLSNESIQSRLKITANTLKTHLRHLYAKTGTANRKELILLVVRRTAAAQAAADRTITASGDTFP